MLMYEIDRYGITKVKIITEDAIKNPYVLKTMVMIVYFILIPIMKGWKNAIDVHPNDLLLSLEISGKNSNWSSVAIARTSTK